jgi:hypothetical protein
MESKLGKEKSKDKRRMTVMQLHLLEVSGKLKLVEGDTKVSYLGHEGSKFMVRVGTCV